jgi:hypothetical protein
LKIDNLKEKACKARLRKAEQLLAKEISSNANYQENGEKAAKVSQTS